MGLLRFLRNVAYDGRNTDHLPNVQRYRAKKFRLTPIIDRQNELRHWACDGELIQAKQAVK